MDKEHSLNADAVIKKLKKLLQVKTDIQLSEILNVKSNTISTWKKRNSLDFNSIIAVCSLRGIDLNEIFCEDKPAKKTTDPLETLLVSRDVLFQYCIGNSGILESLPKYRFPNISTHESRAFQVVSNSMSPLIEENSFVICESTDRHTVLKDNLIVVISRSRGHFIGKINAINAEQDHFILTRENDFFGTVSISFEEISELWLIKGILSYNINNKNYRSDVGENLQKVRT